jgi:hypothetical protein
MKTTPPVVEDAMKDGDLTPAKQAAITEVIASVRDAQSKMSAIKHSMA